MIFLHDHKKGILEFIGKNISTEDNLTEEFFTVLRKLIESILSDENELLLVIVPQK